LSVSPSFLLSDPASFDVTYEINAFMDASVPVDRDLAREQWTALRDTLLAAGADVAVQPAADGLPDMVFANNAAFVTGDRALVARFRHEERAGEVAHDVEALTALGFRVEHPSRDVPSFEGAAEAVPFAGTVVCSHGERTSPLAARDVARVSGLPTLAVELVTDELYHLDVAFCPLDAGTTALLAPHAFARRDLARLLDLVPDPILLEPEEARAFCANSVVVDRTVVMHHVPVRVGRELERRGFTPHEQPVGEFVKSGGSVRCMSLRLDVADARGHRHHPRTASTAAPAPRALRRRFDPAPPPGDESALLA
jgi:N-dimethylarginine dimethylaminohydrolase